MNEICLLFDVWCSGIGGTERQSAVFDCGKNSGGDGEATVFAEGFVDDNSLTVAPGVDVQNEGGADLPEDGGGESGFARGADQRIFVQIVAAEMLIQFAKYGVVFKKVVGAPPCAQIGNPK